MSSVGNRLKCQTIKYHISSYKAVPRIIPAFLIMPRAGTLLCRWNLVIYNNTRSWRPSKKIIPAGLIWGNTVCMYKVKLRLILKVTYSILHFYIMTIPRFWITVRVSMYFEKSTIHPYFLVINCKPICSFIWDWKVYQLRTSLPWY